MCSFFSFPISRVLSLCACKVGRFVHINQRVIDTHSRNGVDVDYTGGEVQNDIIVACVRKSSASAGDVVERSSQWQAPHVYPPPPRKSPCDSESPRTHGQISSS